MRKDILERREEIIKMIDNNEPKSNICKMLNCRPSTLETYLNLMQIEYKGNQGMFGKKTNSDGDRFNNEISNLQILCPNCHSLTPNHSKKKT